MRVLVVDDDPFVRAMLREAISRLARVDVVAEAADGFDGVVLARVFQPDVIVLDLEMPVMSGADALPVLRAILPASTIVLNTAAPSTQISRTVVDLTDALLSKLTDDVPSYIAALPRTT